MRAATAAQITAPMTSRLDASIYDGTALVFSDCHSHPGDRPPAAWRAAVILAKRLKPELIIPAQRRHLRLPNDLQAPEDRLGRAA